MNINLTAAASSKKTESSKTIRSNIFGDDNEHDEPSSIASVNQAVRSEQDALKLRAQKAMQLSDASVYDYDGAYDSFHQAAQANDLEKTREEDRRSRYIGDLLEAAKRRKHEKDIIYEKKIAREQALEEAEQDFHGKEKFVTAAYRRKLEERQLWLAQDERQRKEEEANDVTKRRGGFGLASFYGNLSNNVALGGPKANDEGKVLKEAVRKTKEVESNYDHEKTSPYHSSDKVQTSVPGFVQDQNPYEVNNEDANKEKCKREMRDQKVKEAFERYRLRHKLQGF